jgi:hypothetical protein
VVSILLPLSGLRLLDGFFIGGAKVAEDEGVSFEENGANVEELKVFLPTIARSEPFFCISEGRCGSGGPGLERSG